MKKNRFILFKTFLLSSILIFTILVSCNEEDNNSFCGKVYDMSSGEAVEGVKVYLDATTVSSTGINSAFVQLDETTTDHSGYFFLECVNDSYMKFRLRFEKDGFHSSSYEFNPEDYAWDYSIDHYFARESYIFVRILNILPYADEDEFKVRILGIDELCTECCSDEFRYYFGSYTDTSFTCRTVGGDTVVLYSVSIHEDEAQIKENKIYCIPGDTVFYDCYY